MTQPGTGVFTYVNYGKEATPGTPVAPTRQFYVDGVAVLQIERGQNYHEAENTGRKFRTRRVTQTTEDVNISLKTPTGVSFDDLEFPFSFLNGAATGVGGAADKLWTQTPSATALQAPKYFSMDIGDDVQNWRAQYAGCRSFKISAGIGDVTQLEMDMFAQRALKVAKATPAINAGPKIPSDLWTIKFATSFAGLPGASVVTSFLQSFELQINTGLKPRHYLSGNLYFDQVVETDIGGTLNLTVESTAQAVTQFYDKSAADTMDFIRLRAQGGALGGTNYSSQIDLAVLYEEPEIIAENDDGVNMYKVTAHIADDGTSSIIPLTTNSLAALP